MLYVTIQIFLFYSAICLNSMVTDKSLFGVLLKDFHNNINSKILLD